MAREVIASFDEARLIKYLKGAKARYKLRGGSEADRAEARKWIAMFCPDDVVREA
jgi:hypothetical protein